MVKPSTRTASPRSTPRPSAGGSGSAAADPVGAADAQTRRAASWLVVLAWRPAIAAEIVRLLPRATIDAAIGAVIDEMDRLDQLLEDVDNELELEDA